MLKSSSLGALRYKSHILSIIYMLATTKISRKQDVKSQPMASLSQIHLIWQNSSVIREHDYPSGVQHGSNTWPEENLYTFEL